MIKKSIYTYVLTALVGLNLSACVPIEEQAQNSGNTTGKAQTNIRYQDYVYHPSIQSVQTYLATGGPDQVLNPAVTPLSQEVPLILEFDRINTGPQRLLAKIIHCNADWTASGLNETQYLNDFNEFIITDVQNSINTRVPYVHYRFRIPRVKLSGNYLLLVQEEDGSPLITQRLMVFQNIVTVVAKLGAPLGPGGRETRQPVEFNVYYKDYPIVNPSQGVKAVMRQNYRWDNAKYIPKPTFLHDAQRRLEYVFFEPKDHFKGLSEFRAFDTRSLNFNGIGVQNINLQESPVEVNLQLDKSRQTTVYSQEPDINGMRIFGNRQYGNGEVNGDYTWIDFELKAPEAPGSVYILGELTNWQTRDGARMIYDIERGVYSGRLMLKQGYYNYYYALQANNAAEADASFFEGSHFETDNIYDILIYYRPPGTRADLLIGYEELYFNRK
ncbi:type IX secretion system plug protein domain-containing protein [Pontibacter sp. MBLB2868]|uniref:type IX secretion system plug protein n=1 Tax=Pontibacter sp. MBLB2868 TaxID=3451555 RepID=UPI003F74CE2C